MKLRPPTARRDGVLRGVRAVLSAGVVFCSAILQAPQSKHPIWGLVVDTVHQWGWAVILAGTVVGTWLLTAWINRAGSPKLRRVLDEVLSQFRDNLFGSARGDHADHRVTLFAHKHPWWAGALRKKWPWHGWLIPVARPGHTSQKSHTRFMAPDEASLAEGIAGRAWAVNQGGIVVEDLPELGENPDDSLVQDYADKTHVSPEWVREHLPRSRSLAGFPVNKPDGQRWGVLVLDSTNPTLNSQRASSEYRTCHGKVLGRIMGEL